MERDVSWSTGIPSKPRRKESIIPWNSRHETLNSKSQLSRKSDKFAARRMINDAGQQERCYGSTCVL
jgi:hypothetical protein